MQQLQPILPTENALLNLLNGLFAHTAPQYQMPPLHPLIIQQFGLPPPVVSILDENETNKLKKYKIEKKFEETCSICMGEMDVNEDACELPCKHIFHSECVEPWFKQYNYICPNCKQEVGKPKHNI
jgi:hypothetical protein